MSDLISFENLPITLRVPGQYVEFDPSRAVRGLVTPEFKALLIGQRTSAGTVDELIPTRIIVADQAREAFGVGSMLANMATHFRTQNRFTDLWACAIDDPGGGTASEFTLTCTGTVTAAGTVYLYIAGKRITVGVASGAALADIAADIAAAITADPTLPFTASSAAGVATLVAKNTGATGDTLSVVLNHFIGEELPAGLSIAVANSVNGAGVVDLATIIAALGETQYHVVVMPYLDTAALLALETELTDRWGPIRQNDGFAFAAHADTVANSVTLGAARNSPHVSIANILGVPCAPEYVAAAIAGQVAAAANEDPARPFQTLALSGLYAPRREVRITDAEADTLLHNGISTLYADAGDVLRLQSIISTYQENAFGAPDTAYLYANTLFTLSQLRFQFRARFALKYPRAKLVNDGTRIGSGQQFITPSKARGEAVSIFREWERLGLVEDVDQFKDDLRAERDADNDNRLNILLPPNLVNQLRLLGTQLQFRL